MGEALHMTGPRRKVKTNDANGSETDVVPPDGGWGWVILVGNCILMFLLPTSPVCYGVVYLALVEQQGISNTVASGITAILLGISTLLAPFSTAMASFYSHRKLALIGVILMSVGLLCCSISLNIFWLYFSFVLIGIGNSIGTPQIFLIGQEYFTTKRVTANALASASYTVGYVVLPIILINLISAYSIRGAFLVWAGIMLNGLIGAMLYQPVEWHAKSKQSTISPAVTFSDKVHTIEDGTTNGYESIKTNGTWQGNGYVENHKYIDLNENARIDIEAETPTTPSSDQKEELVEGANVVGNDTESLLSIKEEEDHFKEITSSTEFPLDNSLRRQHMLKYVKDERPCSFVSTTSMDSYCTAKTNFKSMVSIAPSEYFDVMGSWMSIQTIDSESKPLNGSIMDIPEEVTNIIHEELPLRSQRPKRKSHLLCGIHFPYFSDIINLEVLTSPVFLIIAVSSAVYRQVYYGYSSFLPVVAYQKQLESNIPSLLLILALSEVLSKCCTGFIADRGWITARKLYMGSTLINFFALMLTAYSKCITVLSVATGILGLGLGISSSLGPVMLVKYHSLDLLPQSYGLMLFLSGATSLILLPFQGYTIDATGSANYVCYIFASLCLVPLILWCLMPIAQKHGAKTKGTNND